MSTYLEPLGLPALTQRLRDAGDLTYVLTGSLAAYAPARLAMLYVDDPAHAEQALALGDTELRVVTERGRGWWWVGYAALGAIAGWLRV